MKFDAVVGNPPYQEVNKGNGNGADPVYHLFIEAGRAISGRGTFIHPARFLFRAGKTPKDWTDKILDDEHYKVIDYWANSQEVFSNVDVKGGIAITYWDKNQRFNKIGVYSAYSELREIISKVVNEKHLPLANIVYPRDLYHLNEKLYEENPWAIDRPSKGHKYDVGSNVFEVFPELFMDEKPQDGKRYAQIYGRNKSERGLKWVREDYLKVPDNFNYYKVFIPKANGSGAIGEVLSTPVVGQPVVGQPVVGQPVVGHTVTFLSVGKFEKESYAIALLKYIKTKFCRAMLGTLKVTQDNPRETWLNVPMQDFTENSDIDWSKSIPEIDKQLYAKYNLTEEEISFVESMIKPME